MVGKEVLTGNNPVLAVDITQVDWSLDSVINDDNEPITNSNAVITNSPLA
jgi:hypothetical protein